MYPVVSCWAKCLKNHNLISLFRLQSYIATMNFILNDRLAGSRCIVKSVLGENLKGFLTQRVALEEEDQLRFLCVRSSVDTSS